MRESPSNGMKRPSATRATSNHGLARSGIAPRGAPRDPFGRRRHHMIGPVTQRTRIVTQKSALATKLSEPKRCPSCIAIVWETTLATGEYSSKEYRPATAPEYWST